MMICKRLTAWFCALCCGMATVHTVHAQSYVYQATQTPDAYAPQAQAPQSHPTLRWLFVPTATPNTAWHAQYTPVLRFYLNRAHGMEVLVVRKRAHIMGLHQLDFILLHMPQRKVAFSYSLVAMGFIPFDAQRQQQVLRLSTRSAYYAPYPFHYQADQSRLRFEHEGKRYTVYDRADKLGLEITQKNGKTLWLAGNTKTKQGSLQALTNQKWRNVQF